MIFPSSPVLFLITARSSRRRYAPLASSAMISAHISRNLRRAIIPRARRWMAPAAAWISATSAPSDDPLPEATPVRSSSATALRTASVLRTSANAASARFRRAVSRRSTRSSSRLAPSASSTAAAQRVANRRDVSFDVSFDVSSSGAAAAVSREARRASASARASARSEASAALASSSEAARLRAGATREPSSFALAAAFSLSASREPPRARARVRRARVRARRSLALEAAVAGVEVSQDVPGQEERGAALRVAHVSRIHARAELREAQRLVVLERSLRLVKEERGRERREPERVVIFVRHERGASPPAPGEARRVASSARGTTKGKATTAKTERAKPSFGGLIRRDFTRRRRARSGIGRPMMTRGLLLYAILVGLGGHPPNWPRPENCAPARSQGTDARRRPRTGKTLEDSGVRRRAGTIAGAVDTGMDILRSVRPAPGELSPRFIRPTAFVRTTV